MPTWQIITIAVAVIQLLLNIGIAIVGATWGIAKVEATVDKAIAKHRTDFDDKLAVQQQQAGEVATALRTKIHELELWARDTFVRRDSFLTVINEVRNGIGDLGKQIDRRLARIEGRLIGGSREKSD